MAIGITKAETQIDNSSTLGAEGHFIQSDGSVAMDADLRMDDNKITELQDPVDPQDAVNLRTLEDLIGDVTGLIEFFDVTGPANTQFTLSSSPILGSERVSLNGVGPLRPGASNDYTILGDVVTIVGPLKSGDIVTVQYRTS